MNTNVTEYFLQNVLRKYLAEQDSVCFIQLVWIFSKTACTTGWVMTIFKGDTVLQFSNESSNIQEKQTAECGHKVH